MKRVTSIMLLLMTAAATYAADLTFGAAEFNKNNTLTKDGVTVSFNLTQGSMQAATYAMQTYRIPQSATKMAGVQHLAHSTNNATDVSISYGDGYVENAVVKSDQGKIPFPGKDFLYTTTSQTWPNVDHSADNIIPRKGAFVTLEPTRNGTIKLYTILFRNNTQWITTGDKILDTKKATDPNNNVREVFEFTVKAGYKYYYYATGGNGWTSPIYGFEFTPSRDNNRYAVALNEAIYNRKHIRTVDGIAMTYGGWLSEKDARQSDILKNNSSTDSRYLQTGTDTWAAGKTYSSTFTGFRHFTEGSGQNPTNETGVSYDTRRDYDMLPVHGTFYKFEPRQNGQINAYVVQNVGATVYFADENATAIAAVSTPAGLTKDGNNGYTASAKGAYRYSFKVYSGKTYYLFAPKSKLGFMGFEFNKDAAASPQTITIDDRNGYTPAPIEMGNVKLNAALVTNQWNSLILPFTMSEAKVRDVFGEGTEIMQFDDVVGNTIKYKQHYYQHIIAGQPCLIRPTHGYDDPADPRPEGDGPGQKYQGRYEIEGVHIDVNEAAPKSYASKTVKGFSFTGMYDKQVPAGAYFVSESKVYHTSGPLTWKALRSYLVPVTTQAKAMRLTGFSAADDAQTTGINTVGADSQSTTARATNGNIYTLQGVLVRRGATTTEGLPAGIYVMNGKKYVVK